MHGEKRNAQKILVSKPEGKRPPRKAGHSNIKIHCLEIKCEAVNWIRIR
jgi:hypothetical protein